MSRYFLESKGICIIPEGRITKDSKEQGYPYEVSHIYFLEDILLYSKRHQLDVFYLSTQYGISYADDVIKQSSLNISKMTKDAWTKWSGIISEEIIRQCIKRQTSTVYIMCKVKYNYDMIIKNLEARGLEVKTPILGCSSSLIPQRLLF
jgi:hypothetical protein